MHTVASMTHVPVHASPTQRGISVYGLVFTGMLYQKFPDYGKLRTTTSNTQVYIESLDLAKTFGIF